MSVTGDGIIGYNTTLAYGVQGAGTYGSPIIDILEINTPKLSIKKVIKSNLGSPSYTHESFPGMIDPGELTLKILYAKSNENTLYSIFTGRITKSWKMVFPDTGGTTGSFYLFDGWIKDWAGDAVPLDDRMERTIVIQVTAQASGPPSFTQGS